MDHDVILFKCGPGKMRAAVSCSRSARWQPRPHLRNSLLPFGLGVASGYPTATGVVLWTRLVGAASLTPTSVTWEVAGDESMRTIVRRGEASAEPEWAHSVHVEAQGLEPDRWYWYRFSAGDAQSPIGRTRTAPVASAQPARLRFGFASCQHYEQGYFNAYRHMVADDPDLMVFLGDYIYESHWGRDLVRSHASPEPYTLDDYRARYALYKSDPDLQAAHAACPWLMTWDDHEVDNDYADDRPEDGMEKAQFLERRAAAYRAYYEHMPLPDRMRPKGPDMRIYTTLDWGTLTRFYALDDRQYRSWHACPRQGRRGGSNTVDIDQCAALSSPGRSMLGARRSAGSITRSAIQEQHGTSSRNKRPWRSSTRSPDPGGARGPTAGMAIPRRASVSSIPWWREKRATPLCSVETSTPSTSTSSRPISTSPIPRSSPASLSAPRSLRRRGRRND
jgi:phosphodiesterase/alkaline phosphatase D-like protein